MDTLSSTQLKLLPGEILYREGEENNCCYIIETGELVLYWDDNGRRIECERRGAGSLVGELSILTDQPRTVTVEALTECRIFRVSSEQILERFKALDPILKACIETSISFNGIFNRRLNEDWDQAPYTNHTLENSSEIIEQLKLEKEIINALNSNQFSLFYQPIVNLGSGTICGFEALMRWFHPKFGPITPDRFIPVAEATGSIEKLTEFALMEACSALKRLSGETTQDDPLYVSVNVSGEDIGRRNFVDFLNLAVEMHNLCPSQIKLEVTETALIPDNINTAHNLSRLSKLGYGVSIDDFGTGYSNLAYLKTLPLTAIKIDRAFVSDAHANPVSRGIVKMIVGLGVDLNVEIIAEGLETLCDVDTLNELGCNLAQGFYFHRPMPETELSDLLCGSEYRSYGTA